MGIPLACVRAGLRVPPADTSYPMATFPLFLSEFNQPFPLPIVDGILCANQGAHSGNLLSFSLAVRHALMLAPRYPRSSRTAPLATQVAQADAMNCTIGLLRAELAEQAQATATAIATARAEQTDAMIAAIATARAEVLQECRAIVAQMGSSLSVPPTQTPSTAPPSTAEPTTLAPTGTPTVGPTTGFPSTAPSSHPASAPTRDPTSSSPTRAPSKAPATSTPTVAPTTDPCLVLTCSRDCPGGAGCGWDRETHLCRTGFSTSSGEIEELLETNAGDCAHYTVAPTRAPTRAPTAGPSLAPSRHACNDGSHSCDDTEFGICEQVDSGAGHRCSCVRTHQCVPDCETAGHTCEWITSRPTEAPTTVAPTTAAPTDTPTGTPTGAPTTEPPTASPVSTGPTTRPTASPASTGPTEAPTTAAPTGCDGTADEHVVVDSDAALAQLAPAVTRACTIAALTIQGSVSNATLLAEAFQGLQTVTGELLIQSTSLTTLDSIFSVYLLVARVRPCC